MTMLTVAVGWLHASVVPPTDRFEVWHEASCVLAGLARLDDLEDCKLEDRELDDCALLLESLDF